MADVIGPGGWLPDRGVLLHVGPPKTGTTAIQGGLANARPALARRGIVYPGSVRQHWMPALAVTQSSGVAGQRPPRIDEWRALVRDVHAARRRRVVVSSEAFASADDAVARAVVEDLGGDAVHIVVTLRPLAKILPSAWQQYVRNRRTPTYDEWLDDVLVRNVRGRGLQNFWHRHRHDELIRRWVDAAAPHRMVVVVLDEADRLMLTRSFERLLGLPDGLLVADEERDNRGLTAAETELVRQVNLAFHGRKWPWDLYYRVVRLGVVRTMQAREPARDEERIVTPAWAVERANEIAAEASARIRELGVLVIGDLDNLSSVTPPAEPPTPVDDLPASAAQAALEGLRYRLETMADPTALEGNARPVEVIPARELAGIVAERVTRRVNAKLGRGIRRY